MVTVRILLRVLLGLAVLLVLGFGFIFWYDKTGQRSDPDFNPSVAQPVYALGSGPRVVFDVAHNNFHTPAGRYRPFAELLRSDGYRIGESKARFSAASLAAVDVLVIANALGPDGHEVRAAFTDDEEAAVSSWVGRGGSLLLISDHSPFGYAAKRLAARFGITLFVAFARDDKNHEGWDNEVLVFSRANGLLADDAITNGRNAAERVDKVVAFTGQSLSVPHGAVALLRMDDAAYDWESRSVRRSARGHAQGIAMRFGQGKLVVVGEAALFSAQVDPLGFKMGMNKPGNDDRQFALNVLHWLSNALR
jgi:hypothetical protein